MTIPVAPYSDLRFPPPPPGRPYVVCNMVATIDGKTVSGTRDETVMDLGSTIDHAAMRNIEAAADAVMIGAQTLRATPKVRYEDRLFRVVVTHSGVMDPIVPFFTGAPEKAVVAISSDAALNLPESVRLIRFKDFADLLSRLRQDLGVERLLVEGGSELNASLLREDVVDELFLTIAPKLKLGRNLPTYAGGEPLLRGELLGFDLISVQPIGDEVFLRYRRKRG